ncbi:MAG TPA: tetratricopeptide repeat protein [Pyrinomonadaceae bacterium]|nr:tetratricopeptide repeat protein [Pyrinomonadaceae bacterium]
MFILRLFVILFFSLITSPLVPSASAKDTWISLQSRNYHLIGNVKDGEIRAIAIQLERFRHIFTKQFENADLNSPVPTTVVVFKSSDSFGPYKPVVNGRRVEAAGYFRSGDDVNYVTLSLGHAGHDPFELIFHESVHLLVNNKVRASPQWFNEGLAEYFSTLHFLPAKNPGDKRVAFGKPIVRHLLKLRENKLFSLQTLFSVDQSSPYYNERDKSNMFYAQSWALIHYLTHGRSGERQPQLARFLELLAARRPVAESFDEAFDTDYVTLEKELKEYVNQDRFRAKVVNFDEPESGTDSKISALSEAQVLTYLGDLLIHTNRFSEAEDHLKRALAIAPDFSMAIASMGNLKLKQGASTASKELLQKAITIDPNNYLAQYYYANTISREQMDGAHNVLSFTPDSVVQMRTALHKAIEVAPGFPESYRLLAFINLVTNNQLDESKKLLEKALKLSPGRLDFSYVLAQILMRQKNYSVARQTLQHVIAGSPSAEMRMQAEVMLSRLEMEEKDQPKQ